MDIALLGDFGFIERLTKDFTVKNNTTVKGVGDDCAVIDAGEKYLLLTTELILEGIHFDLVYTPLKHLGYKAVVMACSDVCAMNGRPKQLTVSIGLSARFTVEQIEELYQGIHLACEEYGIDMVGGDTTASMTGLALSLTAIGEVEKEKVVYRSGASDTDLVCVTGDLGAAYMGVKLLEREKQVLEGNNVSQPKFSGYEYLLERQLKPRLRIDVIDALEEASILPTSMMDISDGLSSEMLHICKASSKGARIYLDRLPISSKTFDLAEEMGVDPVIAALNGGDDYELLFTVPVSKYEDVMRIGGIDVIGHMTPESKGVALTTPDGAEIAMQAPGWHKQEKQNDK